MFTTGMCRKDSVMTINSVDTEQCFGISKEQAHMYLDMAQAGLWVHPVVLTVSLVITGDLNLTEMEEAYEVVNPTVL